MKIFKLILPVIVSSSFLVISGCESGPKEGVGRVIGGAAGGIAGHQVGGGRGQVAATIAGTLIGAEIGGAVGRSMDEVDRMRMAQTLETTPTGRTTTWQNPDTGYDYSMVPTRTYETAGRPCREYTMNAVIDGRTEVIRGLACRQPDGSWRIVE